jgi:hypothetical protein
LHQSNLARHTTSHHSLFTALAWWIVHRQGWLQ